MDEKSITNPPAEGNTPTTPENAPTGLVAPTGRTTRTGGAAALKSNSLISGSEPTQWRAIWTRPNDSGQMLVTSADGGMQLVQWEENTPRKLNDRDQAALFHAEGSYSPKDDILALIAEAGLTPDALATAFAQAGIVSKETVTPDRVRYLQTRLAELAGNLFRFVRD